MQFSLTRAALSTGERPKSKFLSVIDMRYFARRPDGGPVTFSGLDEIRRSLDKGRITKDWIAHQEGGSEWKTIGVWLEIEKEVSQRPRASQLIRYRLNAKVRVYSAASASSAVVAELAPGAEVDAGEIVTNGTERWRAVTLGNGKTGYVPTTTKALSAAEFQDRATERTIFWGCIIGFFVLFQVLNLATDGAAAPGGAQGGALGAMVGGIIALFINRAIQFTQPTPTGWGASLSSRRLTVWSVWNPLRL
jgi:hypothetical protein